MFNKLFSVLKFRFRKLVAVFFSSILILGFFQNCGSHFETFDFSSKQLPDNSNKEARFNVSNGVYDSPLTQFPLSKTMKISFGNMGNLRTRQAFGNEIMNLVGVRNFVYEIFGFDEQDKFLTLNISFSPLIEIIPDPAVFGRTYNFGHKLKFEINKGTNDFQLFYAKESEWINFGHVVKGQQNGFFSNISLNFTLKQREESSALRCGDPMQFRPTDSLNEISRKFEILKTAASSCNIRDESRLGGVKLLPNAGYFVIDGKKIAALELTHGSTILTNLNNGVDGIFTNFTLPIQLSDDPPRSNGAYDSFMDGFSSFYFRSTGWGKQSFNHTLRPVTISIYKGEQPIDDDPFCLVYSSKDAKDETVRNLPEYIFSTRGTTISKIVAYCDVEDFSNKTGMQKPFSVFSVMQALHLGTQADQKCRFVGIDGPSERVIECNPVEMTIHRSLNQSNTTVCRSRIFRTSSNANSIGARNSCEFSWPDTNFNPTATSSVVNGTNINSPRISGASATAKCGADGNWYDFVVSSCPAPADVSLPGPSEVYCPGGNLTVESRANNLGVKNSCKFTWMSTRHDPLNPNREYSAGLQNQILPPSPAPTPPTERKAKCSNLGMWYDETFYCPEPESVFPTQASCGAEVKNDAPALCRVTKVCQGHPSIKLESSVKNVDVRMTISRPHGTILNVTTSDLVAIDTAKFQMTAGWGQFPWKCDNGKWIMLPGRDVSASFCAYDEKVPDDSDLNCRFQCQVSNLSLTSFSMTGTISPMTSHYGQRGYYYVAGYDPNTKKFFSYNGSNWQAHSEATSNFYTFGSRRIFAAGEVPVVTFNQANLLDFPGASIFLGYGIGDDPKLAWDNMINSNRYKNCTTLPSN